MKIIPLIALCASALFAANLTWENLVSSVDNDPALQASQKKRDAISSGTSTKLWNSLEFQYKLDGFGFMEHDFELRLKPNAWGEGSANKAYWRAQNEYLQSRTDIERSNRVYERYERGLKYLTQKKILKLHQDMAEVNSDRLEVLHLKSGSDAFTPEMLINALEEESRLHAEIISDSNSLQDVEEKLHMWLDFDAVALDTAFLPSIDDIEAFLKNLNPESDNYKAVEVAKQKWEVTEKRYDQEMSSSNRILSSIGIGYKHVFGSYEYDSVKTGTYTYDVVNNVAVADKEWKVARKPDDRRTIDKFYASVSLRLPFFGTDGGDEIKRQIDVLDAENDYLNEKRSVAQKISRAREEMLSLIAQRKVQQSFVERVNAGELFKEFASRAGSDPLMLLRAKQVSLESELRAVKIEYDIYLGFLALLEFTGNFANPDMSKHFEVR